MCAVYWAVIIWEQVVENVFLGIHSARVETMTFLKDKRGRGQFIHSVVKDDVWIRVFDRLRDRVSVEASTIRMAVVDEIIRCL